VSRADLALLLICAIWGTTFALLRDTLRFIPPAELVALRFTIAAVVLVLFYFRRLRGWRPEWVRDGLWIGVWVAAGYLTQVIGLRTVTASRSAFITSMSIAIVPFVAFVMLRTRPVLGESIGVLLAVAGLVLFSADAGFSLKPGELWTLACAAAFAVQIVLTHMAGKRSPAVPISVLQTVVGAAAGWTLVLAGGETPAAPRAIPWGVLLYLGIAATAFIIVLQTWALARTSSVKAGVLYATEPIFAAIFAVSFFGERMTPRELTGAALILAGVFVSELWRPFQARLAGRAARTREA
jgi:drug/metabolite transporter (DMT)-like permease